MPGFAGTRRPPGICQDLFGVSQTHCVLQVHRVKRRHKLGMEIRGPGVGEVSCIRTDKEADPSTKRLFAGKRLTSFGDGID